MLTTPELLSAFATNHLIITPNQHLSHTLLQTFFKTHSAPIQARPACLPFPSFLKTSYALLTQQQTQHSHPILLNTLQAQLLWKQSCLSQTPDCETGLIETAFSAWQLCKMWHVPLDEPQFTQLTHTALFQTWALQFEHDLTEHHYLTEQQICTYLLDYSLTLPYQGVIFACFDDFNTMQIQLQNYLTQLNISVQFYDLAPSSHPVHQLPCQDEQAEREAILGWLQTHVQQQTTPVALIVPRLEQQAPMLKRWLQAHFPDITVAFSFGQPLYDYPLIFQTLVCLAVTTIEISHQQLSTLLSSPFVKGYEKEKLTRLNLLSTLPPLETFTLKTCIELTQPTCPALAHLFATLTYYPQEDTPFNWTIHFMQRLKQMEFPHAPLNSTTYQAHQRFLESLEQLQTLSLVFPLLSLQAILQILTQLTQQTLFQPEQHQDALIHVLGPFEAAGTTYHAAWLMGLTDDQFPGNPSPTPFIPLALQRLYHLPHTDSAHSLSLAQCRLNRFQSANNHLILSYPQKTQDTLNRPSSLIHCFPILSQLATFQCPSAPHTELNIDPAYLPLAPQEHRSRGTFLLSEQAKCSFRAFASQRLMASPLETDDTFFSLAHRGMRLHHALELFWQALSSQTQLLALTPEACASQLAEITHQVVQLSLKKTNSLHISPGIQKLEQERLTRLILSSLDWEATRPHFEIDSLEKKHILHLGPLTFHVRLDRVDKVNQTEKWVTDYKTTCPVPLPWKIPMPLDPQLLAYSLVDPSIKGLLFHELKKGKSMVKGITDSPTPSLSTPDGKTWDEQREQWHTYLTQLATVFHAGSCAAKPVQPTICQACAFQNLCRVEVIS